MKSKITVLIGALLLPLGAAYADVEHSVGIGVQYAGVIGYQASVRSGNSNYRVALGFAGISAGYDHFIESNISLGIQVFAIVFSTGGGINVNYYFTPASSSSWMVGLDVFRAHTQFLGPEVVRKRALVSAGYRF